MRMILRRFVKSKARGIEVALWSRQRARPFTTPQIHRCIRLYSRIRAQSREPQAAASD